MPDVQDGFRERAVVLACHAWGQEQVGGAFKIATELAEYLAAHGHRVCYVCGTLQHCPANPTPVNGVELWRYPYPSTRSRSPRNLAAHVWGAYRLMRQILRRYSVQCLNGHSPLQFLGASLAIPARRIRQVYSVHSPFAQELACGEGHPCRGVRRTAAARAAEGIEWYNCRRATVVQCDSQFTAGQITEICGSKTARKTTVVPGWVDLDRFQPAADVAAARALLGRDWHTEHPIFLSVRRLEPRMGLETLVQAAGVLAQDGPPFRVLIGGSGALEPELRRLIGELDLHDHVRLLGRIPDEQLARCFAAADCFVLPTRALECFGLIILEAYACGTPVIATPVGAIPELIAPQGHQWLTAGTEPRQIAERMAAFIHRTLPSQRETLRLYAQHWSAEAILPKFSGLLLPPRAEVTSRLS